MVRKGEGSVGLLTIVVSLIVFLFASIGGAYPITPNEKTNPGHFCTTKDSHFKEYRYSEKIAYCRRSVSKGKKNYVYEVYGIPKKCRGSYTIDHIIPLSLGGSNQVENLWPEHRNVKKTRQNLEFELYVAVRDSEMLRDEAVAELLDEKFNPPIQVPVNDPCMKPNATTF
jgi:hypothetical protein